MFRVPFALLSLYAGREEKFHRSASIPDCGNAALVWPHAMVYNRAHMKLVAAAIIICKGKVLLARRRQGDSHQGYWEFPGGAAKRGETIQECLARELHEELGVSASVGATIAESETGSGRRAFKLVAMRAYIEDRAFTLTAHDVVAWVSPDELDGYRLAPADIPIAGVLKQRIDLFRP
jgi:8-oxo-dGTP diphosphatase